MFTGFAAFAQLFFSIVIGIYFFNQLKNQHIGKNAIKKDSIVKLEKLMSEREKKLSIPLSEITRPKKLSEIVGQEDGIRALKATLCGPNPQHVIIYGSPGTGKTAAARVVLEEAKKKLVSPFNADSKFIEINATTLSFDERSVADPLMGSVHDPIYQGAGIYGNAGIPQPKPGAVTKAHGGVLFIDEIGELHPIQMNKLLKVLEDRKVYFESSYYSQEDSHIPIYIHEIFRNGLPADFRLVGATTRSPFEMPSALRSRCTEVFFRDLNVVEITTISKNAVLKGHFKVSNEVIDLIAEYAQNGRDAVNIVQSAGCLSSVEGKQEISLSDMEWIISSGKYQKRFKKIISPGRKTGVSNGLAVSGSGGMVIEIEVQAKKSKLSKGTLTLGGLISEQEIDNHNRKYRQKSMAKASIENVITAIDSLYSLDIRKYDIHVNIPGGIPIEGPSAGLAAAIAVYSEISSTYIDCLTAFTGEISIKGKVLPVGSVPIKVKAAKEAGIKKVFIPEANWQKNLENIGIEIIPVTSLYEAISMLDFKNITENIKKTTIPDIFPAYAKNTSSKKLLN